jgi:hypothetical protein
MRKRKKISDSGTLRTRDGVRLQRSVAVRNILAWAGVGNAGNGFYFAAREICEGMADRYGLTLEQVAGIVAALSPQTPWDRNLQFAETFCKNRKVAGVPKDRAEKCAKILQHTCPEIIGKTVFGTNGPKIESFYWNILGDSSRVTIDSHAVFSTFYHPSQGIPTGDFLTPLKGKGPRAATYRFFEGAYISAAKRLQTEPSELQALVWANVRQAKGLAEHVVTVPF